MSQPLLRSDLHKEPQRRKLRKGTTSCWECKNRKMRCQFRSSAKVCVGCQRRGTNCLSQEFPEGSSSGEYASNEITDKRLNQVEAVLENLVGNLATVQSHNDPDTTNAPPYVSSTTSPVIDDVLIRHSTNSPGQESDPSFGLFYSAEISNQSGFLATSVPPGHKGIAQNTSPNTAMETEAISKILYKQLPSQRDASLIIGASKTSMYLQLFTLPYDDLFNGRIRSMASMSKLPHSTSHPVILARSLLYLAIGIQQLHPSNFNLEDLDLKEPRNAMARYLDIASSLVVSNDRLIGSLEGLECLILEAVYHINGGNLRRAWLLLSRARGLGQLMGLHREVSHQIKFLNPETISSAAFMWYRIIQVERYTALLLGLPAGSAGNNIFMSERVLQKDCPSGNLERIHCVISGRIIERNEGAVAHDLATTKDIDRRLQEAAQSMPASWWRLSNLSDKASGEETMEDLVRILLQISHYSLIILLHLPYMLRLPSEAQYDYSKTACTNASRELLTRFIRFRSFKKVAFGCRGVDFNVFTASMVLLLAHLRSHRNSSGRDDFLPHQRLSDRATIEECIDIMPNVNSLSNDGLTKEAVTILSCLLAIEANAANDGSNDANEKSSDSRTLQLTIPYFGTITITPEGIIKSPLSTKSSYYEGHNATTASGLDTPIRSGPSSIGIDPTSNFGSQPSMTSPTTTPVATQLEQTILSSDWPASQLQEQEQTHININSGQASSLGDFNFQPGFLTAHETPIGIMSETDHWALQGVDRAFFEYILRD